MKKKIAAILIGSMLFTGVISASSLWGTYKGNPIIRITSNGTPLKTLDVPAISIEGRTMVPISMLGQLGLSYTWDSKNQSVDVNVKSDTDNQIKREQYTTANTIKKYVSYADYFHELEILGNMLSDLSVEYDNAFNLVNIKSEESLSVLERADESILEILNMYNNLSSQTLDFQDKNIKTIFKDYYNAVDYFYEAGKELKTYHYTKSKQSLNTFSNSIKKATGFSGNGRALAELRYSYYIQSALDAK